MLDEVRADRPEKAPPDVGDASRLGRAYRQAVRVGVLALALLGCSEKRETPTPPTFEADLRPIFAARCDRCHSARGAGGFSTLAYLPTISCLPNGRAATLPTDSSAPLYRVLSTPSHAAFTSVEERAVILRWLEAGAPKSSSAVHPEGFIDPRSNARHGLHLRELRWAPMLDATRDDACGRCHEGAPSGRPARISSSAPGATACTSCHSEPQGALACTTCHGGPGQSAPPRDTCFFPAKADAHPAHASKSASSENGLACTTCHPGISSIPGLGSHGNGTVDVVFDPKTAGAGQWDASKRSCTTACHARGGDRPSPEWSSSEKLSCTSCHGAPPARHYEGACSGCHREANENGTALTSPALHVNGTVDLGDGSKKCGACHGQGDDPWPKTGAHAAHANPKAASPVPCSSCHSVPTSYGAGTGHPSRGRAIVAFSGRAVNGVTASYANGVCSNVACHGAGLVGTIAASPSWSDTSGKESKCGACHGIPPGAPHVTSDRCETCHVGITTATPAGPMILDASRHVNGIVDR